MKYIDADRLIHDLEERIYAYSEGYADGDDYRKDAIETLLKDVRYQCSLQQEQDIKSELKEEKIESSPVIKEFISKFFEIGRAYNFGFGPKDFLQEQPESSNSKFVFPNFLYARTVDNKTIDVSYAPQSLDAVEYIKNDHIEQPKVDLEKFISDFIDKKDCENQGKWCEEDIIEAMKSSFALGLNARKV